MDKVIDGVDVSECEYANACDKKLKCVILQDDVCETKPYCEGYNCYYKQLQRAKAENERLKEENEQLKKSIDRIMQNKEIKTIDSEIALLNAELQQENKRLIARLRPLEDSYFNGLSSIEIAELAKKSIRITAENRKLEDALQEIRDIFSHLDEHNWFHTGKNIYMDDKCINEIKTRILTKINSVIGAE